MPFTSPLNSRGFLMSKNARSTKCRLSVFFFWPLKIWLSFSSDCSNNQGFIFDRVFFSVQVAERKIFLWIEMWNKILITLRIQGWNLSSLYYYLASECMAWKTMKYTSMSDNTGIFARLSPPLVRSAQPIKPFLSWLDYAHSPSPDRNDNKVTIGMDHLQTTGNDNS